MITHMWEKKMIESGIDRCVSSSSESKNRFLRMSWICRQHPSTGLSSGEFGSRDDGEVVTDRQACDGRRLKVRRTVSHDDEIVFDSLHNTEMKCVRDRR